MIAFGARHSKPLKVWSRRRAREEGLRTSRLWLGATVRSEAGQGGRAQRRRKRRRSGGGGRSVKVRKPQGRVRRRAHNPIVEFEMCEKARIERSSFPSVDAGDEGDEGAVVQKRQRRGGGRGRQVVAISRRQQRKQNPDGIGRRRERGCKARAVASAQGANCRGARAVLSARPTKRQVQD